MLAKPFSLHEATHAEVATQAEVATHAARPEISAPRGAAGPTVRLGYRADIDGLRAIAVIAVVATHAHIAGMAGGFIGVDIFFVISGYLITRNLESAPRAGLRGLVGFYGRRMRRTLPALYLVAGVTLAAGAVFLLPGEYDDLARSLLCVLLFVPNILFLNQASYFDTDSLARPLLHTWSLGVEEQFYLIAPLLPFALRRLGPSGRKTALLGLFGLAFLFCLILRASNPSAAFFLMPARLWEFLAGCLVAEGIVPVIEKRWLAEAIGIAALLDLAASIATFSAATDHPGLPTLIPCVATAALIHLGASRTTLASRLLGTRVLAGLGLISYSIYLWHWPLIAFTHVVGVEPSAAWQVAAIIALLGISILSWRFVEVPFRAAGSAPRRRKALTLVGESTKLVAGQYGARNALGGD